MHIRANRIALPIVLMLALLWATPAVAAPTQWSSVEVTLHSEESGNILLVSGVLPDSVSLPAEAELSVPTGSQIQWVGEILGGDPAADPELQYTKSVVGSSDVYRFTLTKSRTAQLEVFTNATVSAGNGAYSTVLNWVSTQEVPEVTMSARIPAGAQVLQTAPGATLQAGPQGYSYYTITTPGVKAGDELSLVFTYQVPVGAAANAGQQSSGTAGQVIVIFLAILGAAGGAFAVGRKMSQGAPQGQRETNVGAKPRSAAGASAKTVRASGKGDTQQQRVVKAREPEEDAGSPATDGPSGSSKRLVLTLGVIAAVVAAVLLVGEQTTRPVVEGDTITQTFSQGQPCSNATFAIKLTQGTDPQDIAEIVFEALRKTPGMNTATFDLKSGSLQAGYCESKASEESVRAALEPTGLLAASVESTVQTSVSPQAVGQSLAVDTSSGNFSPSQLTAAAGEPVEITFGQGSGCLSEVVFPDLGIRQSLENGPVTVKLPALEPGVYSFACGMDMQRGSLVVK